MDKATSIQVGQGGTYHCGSDRYPVTVLEVHSSRVTVQRDTVKWTICDKNDPECEFIPDPNGNKTIISRRKNGRWYEVGRSPKGVFFTFENGRGAHLDLHR